jgi:hypothetical protein
MKFRDYLNEEFKWPAKMLKDLDFIPISVDEWYGVEIRFKWKNKTFYDKWLKGPGKPISSFGNPNEEHDLVQRIAAEALKSPKWKQFLKKFGTISADRSSIDSTQVERRMPKFIPRDFSDWEFWHGGGRISATDR